MFDPPERCVSPLFLLGSCSFSHENRRFSDMHKKDPRFGSAVFSVFRSSVGVGVGELSRWNQILQTTGRNPRCIQGLFLVPLKGGIGSIFDPPEGKDYKWYISGIFPANWGMDYATYHLLGEPETTIDVYIHPGNGSIFPSIQRHF